MKSKNMKPKKLNRKLNSICFNDYVILFLEALNKLNHNILTREKVRSTKLRQNTLI